LTTSRTAALGRTSLPSLQAHPKDRAPPRFLQEKFFRPILLAALILCAALYAEETLHFARYGWSSPDNDAWTRDISNCRLVPGSTRDIDCPVRGYGHARYRFGGHQIPTHREIFFIDRIQ